MSRHKIERRYRKMQADAKAFGAELLTEESIFIDDDHLDCVWYGGHIGGLRYKGYEVSVEVHGDVEIVGFMNGRDFLYKNNAAYRADLDKKGYKYEFMETPGGHVWTCWRIYLSVFAPKLFK